MNGRIIEKLEMIVFPQIWFWKFVKGLFVKPMSETKSIVILGHKGAGKTSLWSRLKDESLKDGYRATSLPEEISAFQLSLEDKTVTIKETHDVGGGNDSVRSNYEIVLKDDGTFIYYLIEYGRTEECKKDIRAQLQKIAEILHSKEWENYGFKIIFTNFDKTKTITKQDAMERLSKLKLKSIIGLNKLANFVDRCDALNMYNDDDIKSIKNEIINGIKGLEK